MFKNRVAHGLMIRPASLSIAWMVAVAATAFMAACTWQPSGGIWPEGTRKAQSMGQRIGLDVGTPAPGAARGEGDIDGLLRPGGEAGAMPSPDDWRVITSSLNLFRHPPYVVDLVLGLAAAIGVALALTSAPRRALRTDPLARAEQRKATVTCALIGCIAAELVQASEQILLGAEIALVLFGIGGLVRFRTVFEDARQTGTAIIGTVLGLACGMSEYSLVALALAVVVVVQWWLTRRTLVRLRVRARRGVDVVQLQAAVTGVLQQNDFRVSRVTPTSAKREIEVQASTETDFDVDALVSTLHGALPGARIRIDVS